MKWKEEISVARRAAVEAGKILTARFGQVNRVIKKGEIDLVTEADLLSERAILDVLGRRFPRDGILSEEAGEIGQSPDRIWVIDPLDGTTNFAHDFPFFAVSIALQVNGEVVLGIVFSPFLNECFEAVKGRGAFLNQVPIRVSQTGSIGDALLATGFPYTIHDRPEEVLARFAKLIVLAQGIRRPGSAAMDLCYVAQGRFDGFWEEGLKPWDTAAGVIIVEEAGGQVSTYEGGPYTPYDENIIASNGQIHGAMAKALSS